MVYNPLSSHHIHDFVESSFPIESPPKTKTSKIAIPILYPVTSESESKSFVDDFQACPIDVYSHWHRIFWQNKKLIEFHPEMSIDKRHAFAFFSIQYLCKVANISFDVAKSLDQKLSISPLQSITCEYHRNYFPSKFPIIKGIITKLLENLRCRISINEIFLLNDNRFEHFLHTATTYTAIKCPKSFADQLPEILTGIEKKLDRTGSKFFFRFPLETLETTEKISIYIRDQVVLYRALIDKGIKDHLKEHLSLFNKKNFLEKISLCAFSVFEGQEIFILPDLGISHKSKQDFIQDNIITKGFTPTLQESCRTLARLVPLDKLATLVKSKIFTIPHTLKPSGLVLEKKVLWPHSLDDLLKHPIWLQFRNKFSKNLILGHASMLILPLCQLFEGFFKFGSSFEEAFKEVPEALHDSLYRLLSHIHNAMEYSYDKHRCIQFECFFNLLFEELILWFSIFSPYTITDLKRAIGTALTHIGGSATNPDFIRITSNGVKCVSEIMEVLITKNKNVLLHDTYFEIDDSIRNVENPEKGNFVFTLEYPDFGRSLEQHIKSAKESTRKFDIIFCDFHRSVSGRTRIYEPVDISHLINTLQKNECLSPTFTVAIDNTIGIFGSKEISQLLFEYREQIASGVLNIIIYWSMQKFDMLGADKLTGGCYCLYTTNKELLLNFKMLDEICNIDPINIQGFTHIYTHLPIALNSYRELMFLNAEFLYIKIDPDLKYFDHTERDIPLLFTCKKDTQTTFIDLWINSEKYGNLIYNYLETQLINKLKIPYRTSFGFQMTTFCGIGDCKIRFSIGLETESILSSYADFFNDLGHSLNGIKRIFDEVMGIIPQSHLIRQCEIEFITECMYKLELTKKEVKVVLLEMFFEGKKVDGYNLLHVAALSNRMDLIESLIKNGMDINSKTKEENQTILHLASIQGFKEMILSILSHPKIDITIKDHHEKTAFELAKNTEIADLFLEKETALIKKKRKFEEEKL